MKAKLQRVGEVAKQFGISTQTIHWYEAQGLLPQTDRSQSGYRQYSQKAVDQIAFVRKALLLGLSVAEIKEVIGLREHGNMPCEHVMSLLDQKIARITEQIYSLEQLRSQLTLLQTKWKTKPLSNNRHDSVLCPIIEES